MNDLFDREQQIFNAASARVNIINEGGPCNSAEFETLANEYGRLLKQLRRITRISDRTTVNLNTSRQDLLEKLLRMSSLAESSPNFISYKKLTGECVYINPAASLITGYSRDELMEDYIKIMFDGATADYLRNEIPAALAEKGVLTYEVSARMKNGEQRILLVHSFLVESDEKAFGTVATDITEKKRVETEKMEALKKAEEASRARSDFLSKMSHEMRTPMNAVIGMAALAKKADSMDEIQKCVGKISDAAIHLLGIIDDVLDISKIEGDKMELSEEEFHFEEALNQTATAMNFNFDAKCQNFSMEIGKSIPKFIMADKQKLKRVIANLLGNANKFTPEGGNISLSVRKAEDYESRCKLQFTVEDDGVGIPEEQQERVFHAFEQLDNTITRQYGGTGLGLAISQRFVGMMGGRIWVESVPGEGSRFSFTIDAGARADVENERPDADGLVTDGAENIFTGKRALLADDVEINREILIALLDGTGIAVDCAGDGQTACDIFASNPECYDIIFMDIHMPGMNGYEAAGMIRKMNTGKSRTIPIIAVTADVSDEDIEAAGMNGYISKPLDIDIVISTMKQYLL